MCSFVFDSVSEEIFANFARSPCKEYTAVQTQTTTSIFMYLPFMYSRDPISRLFIMTGINTVDSEAGSGTAHVRAAAADNTPPLQGFVSQYKHKTHSRVLFQKYKLLSAAASVAATMTSPIKLVKRGEPAGAWRAEGADHTNLPDEVQ